MNNTQYQIGLSNYLGAINRTSGQVILYKAMAYIQCLKNTYAGDDLIDQMETQTFYSYALTSNYLRELIKNSSVREYYINKESVIKKVKAISIHEKEDMLNIHRFGGIDFGGVVDERFREVVGRIHNVIDLENVNYGEELESWLHFYKVSEFMMLMAIEKFASASNYLGSHVGMSVNEEFDSLMNTVDVAVSIITAELNLGKSEGDKLNLTTA